MSVSLVLSFPSLFIHLGLFGVGIVAFLSIFDHGPVISFKLSQILLFLLVLGLGDASVDSLDRSDCDRRDGHPASDTAHDRTSDGAHTRQDHRPDHEASRRADRSSDDTRDFANSAIESASFKFLLGDFPPLVLSKVDPTLSDIEHPCETPRERRYQVSTSPEEPMPTLRHQFHSQHSFPSLQGRLHGNSKREDTVTHDVASCDLLVFLVFLKLLEVFVSHLFEVLFNVFLFGTLLARDQLSVHRNAFEIFGFIARRNGPNHVVNVGLDLAFVF